MLREWSDDGPSGRSWNEQNTRKQLSKLYDCFGLLSSTNILIVTHMCMYCTAQHICPEHLQTSSMKGRRALFGTSSLISSETR